MTAPKCRNCKRPLRDAVSREREYGPDCWRARQPVPLGAILHALPIARRAAEIADGQLAIDEEACDGDV